MNNVTLDMTSDEPATAMNMASAISTKSIQLSYLARLQQLYLDYETGDKPLPERLVIDMPADDQMK